MLENMEYKLIRSEASLNTIDQIKEHFKRDYSYSTLNILDKGVQLIPFKHILGGIWYSQPPWIWQ